MLNGAECARYLGSVLSWINDTVENRAYTFTLHRIERLATVEVLVCDRHYSPLADVARFTRWFDSHRTVGQAELQLTLLEKWLFLWSCPIREPPRVRSKQSRLSYDDESIAQTAASLELLRLTARSLAHPGKLQRSSRRFSSRHQRTIDEWEDFVFARRRTLRYLLHFGLLALSFKPARAGR